MDGMEYVPSWSLATSASKRSIQRFVFTDKAVSRILPHIHPCLIYEAIMRHIRDIYEAIMKQISIIFSKNEVVGAAIFVY